METPSIQMDVPSFISQYLGNKAFKVLPDQEVR
jgi:hypothetical protein